VAGIPPTIIVGLAKLKARNGLLQKKAQILPLISKRNFNWFTKVNYCKKVDSYQVKYPIAELFPKEDSVEHISNQEVEASFLL